MVKFENEPQGFQSSVFKECFRQLLPTRLLNRIFNRWGPVQHGPRFITPVELILGLVFHVIQGGGTLAQHVKEVTGKRVTEGALSQRRLALPWAIFQEIMAVALRPKADPRQHPEAFYRGLRLCGLDGSRASVANTPQIKARLFKAASRRHKAAFAKISLVTVVELGLHNPIAAAVGSREESEAVLASQLWDRLPERSLLLMDRGHGAAKRLLELRQAQPEGQREFLVRVKTNLKARVLEAYADASALVEIRWARRTLLVREIQGVVRRTGGRGSCVRLWTSLLDWRSCPAQELLALYGQRWEQEGFYRELKVDLRSAVLLRSHTPETSAQEIAALLVAHALLVGERIRTAALGQVAVLRISFAKTLAMVQSLWRFLECARGLLTSRQIGLLVGRAMRGVAEAAIPKRRPRSCPRKLRQPVSSWPRLLKNTYEKGPFLSEIIPFSP